MRKKTKLLLWMGIAAGFVYAACRKTDRQTPPPGVTKEEKFFTFRKASDPLIQAITDYMQRQNEKLHYVEKTVSQIGYPYWDKAVIADTHGGADRGASGTSNIIYVPFVRDSENFVNASLVIHATAADTSFSYMCDWQYSDTAQTGMPKKAAALTMIRLDNAVFGNRLFQLTDSSLFGRSAKYMKLGSVTNNRGSLAGKPKTQAYVYSYTICWTEWEDQFEGQVHGCVPGPTCFEYNEVNSCLEISWTVGGDPSAGGGGGTGGSGTSGGGGSGSPGTGTPPPSPCGQTGGLRPGTATPCGAGWVPLPNPDGGGAPPPDDSTIAQNLKRLILKTKSIADSVYNLAQQQSKEWTFTFIRNVSGDTATAWIHSGTSHSSSPSLSANSFAVLHTHYEDDSIGGSDRNQTFDGRDIYYLYKVACIDGDPVAVSIVNTRDYYYAAVITDPIKFRDYIRTICGTQNLYRIEYLLNELHVGAMDACVSQPTCNWQKKCEMGVLAITANNNSSVSGIKIFRSPKQHINFTLLTP